MAEISAITVPNYVGYGQFEVVLAAVAANLARVQTGVAALAPPSGGLVVLPELWATGFAYPRLAELAQETPNLLAALRQLAAAHGIFIAGSLAERVVGETGEILHNTLYLVGPEGIVGSYRKQQLFHPMHEDSYFQPGANPHSLPSPIGRLAAAVCYDLRFPELVKSQVVEGAGVLLVSAQWPTLRRDHWRALAIARAIENQIFVVAANRCGSSGPVEFGGHSLVVAPDGRVLQEAGADEEWAGVVLDPNLLATVRGRFNTASATPYRFPDEEKVVNLAKLKNKVTTAQALGRRVVFTNGCFDILHAGHVGYLEAARREGDCLIVGLNSDRSIRALKGPSRPVNGELERARVLAALGCVDFVVLFDDDTPQQLIATLLPNILVKGADWPVEKIVGAPEVLSAGGQVANIPLVGTFSTTAVIKKIRGEN